MKLYVSNEIFMYPMKNFKFLGLSLGLNLGLFLGLNLSLGLSLTRNHQEVCPRKFFSNKVESIEKKYIRNTYLFVFTQKFQRAVFFGLKIFLNKVQKNIDPGWLEPDIGF